MGILSENLTWLLDHAKPGCSMLELGNQFLYICAKPFPSYPDRFLNLTMAAPVAAKPFFVELGIDHVSIDINGNDGALPLDLAQPQPMGREFDIVTDFGTSEHVPCLYQCLKNVYDACRVGGKMAHVNPLTGNWPGHGYWYRDEEFYTAYANLTGLKLLDTRRTAACGNVTDGWNIWALLEKTPDSKFPDKETFYKLPIKKS